MRSPGEPLNPSQLAGVQEALPASGFLTPTKVGFVGYGLYHVYMPSVTYTPLDHANYQAVDVPFQPLRVDYQS